MTVNGVTLLGAPERPVAPPSNKTSNIASFGVRNSRVDVLRRLPSLLVLLLLTDNCRGNQESEINQLKFSEQYNTIHTTMSLTEKVRAEARLLAL
jgi:hypothetical protein